MTRHLLHQSLGLLAAAAFCGQTFAALPQPATNDSFFATPLRAENLDPAAFAEWVDGSESPMTLQRGPAHIVWTRTTAPEWDGVTFGESKTSGPRHLRIAWQKPVAVGSVLVRGGGQVSALKPNVAYPGRLGTDADWIPAERLRNGGVSLEEAGQEDYALWTLPPGTVTRALRFTHTSRPIDKTYAGWLGGVFLLRERLANVAPQALATAGENTEKAERLINTDNDNMWSTWANEPETNRPVVSEAGPAWVMLTWPHPVELRGLNALWAGFSAAEAQVYVGPDHQHPRNAAESDWRTIRKFDDIENQYPRALGVNWMDFGRPVTTRAVRLRITRTIDETTAHNHLKGKTRNGRRVWLGELMALHPLGDATLASTIIAPPQIEELHPPIPIHFTLPEVGFVTLVIDDAQGRRVRNVIAETKFPAGQNTVWWDGMDDLLRDRESARHGVYHIPAQFVPPATYHVHGLWHKAIDLRYEFSIYNAGTPAWETADSTGAWLANHTPPSAALFVPAQRAPGGQPLVFLGSYVSEGGHGLAWVDLNGRKQGGVGWVGGNWTGAPYLARDDGSKADPEAFGYAAAAWSQDKPGNSKEKPGEIRLTALTRDGRRPVLKYNFTPEDGNEQRVEWSDYIGGLAAHDGLLVVSLTRLNQLLFVDAKEKRVLGTTEIPNPRGLAFDPDGRLLVLSEDRLLRFTIRERESARGGDTAPSLGEPETLVPALRQGSSPDASLLEAPCGLALDTAGNLYISDRGTSHQVKVFSPDGEFLRAIGKAGAPKAGPYDPLHMNHPAGLTIDSLNRLWVTENDFQPKRVSVWTLDGRFVRAFYGPSEYGGGGKLDPEDKTKFYYHGMEFRLDWEKGTDQLVRVFHRPGPNDLATPDGHTSSGFPEQPHDLNGRKYFSNDHNSNPTGGPGAATLWLMEDGIARPVAALGRGHEWSLLKTAPFRPLWPKNVDPNGDYWRNATLFVWSDANGDHQAQTNEVTFQKEVVGSVTVAPDLSFVVSRVGSNAMRFPPVRFTTTGVPIYDLSQGQVLARDVQGPVSSGGDQALWNKDGWTILTTPPAPFSPSSIGGVCKGEPRWQYPSLWPGLHASHESPPPAFPGMVIGTTRLLGGFVTPRHSDAGPLWSVNGNQGNMYLFTEDGLFIAQLFRDVRRGPTWSMPVAQRGMLLNDLTLHDENFWPSITQTEDGQVYLVDGARSSLVRVDGLESIQRLPETAVTLSAADLAAARAYVVGAEAARQKAEGQGTLRVTLGKAAPVVDGALDDWNGADWVDIDKSGVAAYFNSNSKPYDVRGAVAVSGDRLYAAFRTGDPNLLRNTGAMPKALFKTGGALDLMIGTNAGADDSRSKPVAGDVRLLISEVNGKPLAMLYRAVVPGTVEPVPFSSPWRTITLDEVNDVSSEVTLAGANGNFEISIPLAALGLKPQAGQQIKGDIGILRGNGFQTVQRVYWANKATGITADVPSEAELTPQLWGRWEFVE